MPSRRRRRRRKRVPDELVEAFVSNLSHDGRGIAKVNGKTVFIDGALPGETVVFKYVRCFSRFDEAVVQKVLSPSPHRVTPICSHFMVCGGCSLQHMNHAAQVKAKQEILLEQLEHFAGTSPKTVLEPMTGPIWGYRRSARLGARLVPKKDGVLVGFREKHSSYIADLKRCEVLHPSVGHHILSLRELLSSLSIPDLVPQIEVAVADNGTALVIRHLKEFVHEDKARISHFARTHGFVIYLQPGGPETVYQLWPNEVKRLYYDVADIRLFFEPGDFIQVNAVVNQKMVAKALDLLSLQPDETVLDLFCGIGNFSLPMARRAKLVLGIEGSSKMVERAALNAKGNGINNAIFKSADLTREIGPIFEEYEFSKILLDPPRCGAVETMEHLAKSGAEKILYISCNPATLSRDAGILLSKGPYELTAAGVVDMFPHTSHAEAMALFHLV